MHSVTACVVLIFFVAYGSASFYTDCGSTLSKIENIKVSGCEESDKICTLKRNTNVTISFDLTPNDSVNVEKVNTVVHGIMMGLPVPFILGQPDACIDTGLTCPLSPNVKYSYAASLPVLKTYPLVTVDVKWELQNEKNVDLSCLLINARIH